MATSKDARHSGLADACWHTRLRMQPIRDLRHSYASILAKGGAPIYEILRSITPQTVSMHSTTDKSQSTSSIRAALAYKTHGNFEVVNSITVGRRQLAGANIDLDRGHQQDGRG